MEGHVPCRASERGLLAVNRHRGAHCSVALAQAVGRPLLRPWGR